MTQILHKLSKNEVVSSIFPASKTPRFRIFTLSAQGTMGWFALKSARARENLTRYRTKNKKKWKKSEGGKRRRTAVLGRLKQNKPLSINICKIDFETM